jgi:hypothetical protein
MQPGDSISLSDKIIAATNTLQHTTPAEIREQLISLLEELINTDFQALVQLLYRVDVDEKKLKQTLLQQPGHDAALIIAELIISRQLQKIATRKQFNGSAEPPPGGNW